MGNAIVTKTVAVTTTGSAGSATGSNTADGLYGKLLDIYLDYDGTAPATTDVTISESVMGTILTRSNTATDGRFAVRAATHDNTGAAISSQYTQYTLSNSTITVSVAQSNALAPCVTAYIRYEEAF